MAMNREENPVEEKKARCVDKGEGGESRGRSFEKKRDTGKKKTTVRALGRKRSTEGGRSRDLGEEGEAGGKK